MWPTGTVFAWQENVLIFKVNYTPLRLFVSFIVRILSEDGSFEKCNVNIPPSEDPESL